MRPCFNPLLISNELETLPSYWIVAHVIVYVKRLHNVVEIWRISNLQQYCKQSFPTYKIKSFSKVNYSNIQKHVLFIAFFLQLSYREYYISGRTFRPNSTLGLWIYSFSQLLMWGKITRAKALPANPRRKTPLWLLQSNIIPLFLYIASHMSCGTIPSNIWLKYHVGVVISKTCNV